MKTKSNINPTNYQVFLNRNSKNCIMINNRIMKKSLLTNSMKFLKTGLLSSRRLVQSMMVILAFSGLALNAQPAMPDVTVRFANPVYDCPTNTYCVDVQFRSNLEEQWVYGSNIRFFYDDAELEYLGTSHYLTGYNSVEEPEILTGPPGSGAPWGFNGPVEWFNGTLQLVTYDQPIYLSTTGWTTMCKICFRVDNPNALDKEDFCPSLVWDLKEPQDDNPPESGDGFLPGDDGVVVTVVDLSGNQDSYPTFEIVQQFNWEYDQSGNSYGYNVPRDCISTICGYKIPISNWSVFLAIGLMLIVSVFIYRRRIS